MYTGLENLELSSNFELSGYFRDKLSSDAARSREIFALKLTFYSPRSGPSIFLGLLNSTIILFRTNDSEKSGIARDFDPMKRVALLPEW